MYCTQETYGKEEKCIAKTVEKKLMMAEICA